MKKHQEIMWRNYHLLNDLALSSTLQEWLLYRGSFVQRLTDFGVANARIEVLQQDWLFPEDDERERLNINSSGDVFVREVLILSEDKIWMFARTVIPRATLTGKLSQLTQLKNRSLGSVLFSIPNLERSEFGIACLQPGTQWYEKISCQLAQYITIKSPLWARRSTFALQNKSLLLTEVFLPDIETL